MTPIECMKLQLDRGFSCTLGCAELERVGRKVLLDLCYMNRWDSWLRRSEYTDKPEDTHCLWSHGHWAGVKSNDCSFNRYVKFHPTDQNRFQVDETFIDAMHFSGAT